MLLDTALIADTLTALPGWNGNATLLWREVHLSAPVDAELRRQVTVDAAAMGHTVGMESVDDATRFVVTSDGGVTELDVMLASHISDLVHRLSAAEPGIEAARNDDPVVVFRAGEAAGAMSTESHDNPAAGVGGGGAPINLPAGIFSPQDSGHS